MKVFRLDLTPEQAQALADELQRTSEAGLEHHSIVLPLGAGVEGTVPYAAAEYVAAESLDVALKHYAPAPIDKVLPFITQLAGAIDFAWTVGIGLGALHPRDIFVTPDEARVTGFGVVQALERIGVRAPVRRPYTAPERVDGGEWNVRADVYSVGAIAFELLTARRPVGPDVGDIGSTAGPNGPALAQAISRALADDPADRYPSALAFAAALEAASRGEAAAAIGSVPAAAPHDDTVAAVSDQGEPFDTPRTLVVEPDIDVEREADEAEIQLREEAFAPEPADVEREPLPVFPTPVEPPPVDQDFGLRDAQPEPQPEASLFDLEREIEPEPQEGPEPQEETVREVPAAAFPTEPRTVPPPFASSMPPPVDRSPRGAPPRPVFLPIALTLLLGLFVGFLAGYLVGSRETVTPVGDEAASQASREASPQASRAAGSAASQARSGVSGTGSAARGDRPAPPASSGTSGAPSSTAAARPPASASRSSVPPPAARVAPARGRLMVRSTPAGALVFVNGRRRGTTPLAVRDLAPGTYTLRVARSGYAEQSRRITVGGPGVREVNLRLEPTRPAAVTFTGSIYVDSRPRGARVYLDGKDIGATPMQAGDIRAGTHVVRLELKDHRTWTASTRVVAGEVTRVTGSLERQQ